MSQSLTEVALDAWEPLARSLRLNGQSTSIRLERAFWAVLDRIAVEQRRSTASLISAMHRQMLEQHGEVRNFTSVLRCACLAHALRQPTTGKSAESTPTQRYPNGM